MKRFAYLVPYTEIAKHAKMPPLAYHAHQHQESTLTNSINNVSLVVLEIQFRMLRQKFVIFAIITAISVMVLH